MLFKLKTNDFRTLMQDDIHYLSVDTTWMGSPLRLGDLTMTSCLLFCLKQQLITSFPDKFNTYNLYFILNRIGGLNVGDIRLTLSLFPHVWKDIGVGLPEWYNVRQIISGGNIWSFKWYLEEKGIKISNITDKAIIDPSHLCLTGNKKLNTYLFPVRNKRYNVERNMDYTVLSNIINKQIGTVHVITKDTDIDINKLKSLCNTPITEVNKDRWFDILLDIMMYGKLFISGDCGLSHFVSMIHPHFKPAMEIYYRTQSFYIKKANNQFDESAKFNRNKRQIDFIPYSPYLTDDMNIKTF